ncbi:MAG: PH domain-containing protein [Alphaproteobacteria bacterium]|nr:PH domain-containing protein [Alphaproteobacteria bacterium]
MLYVEQSLGPDEELVHVGQFHWLYTVQAFMSIIWGVILSVMIIAGAVVIYKQFGWFKPDVAWLDAVRDLHPGVRIFSFIVFVLGLLGFAQKMVIKATTEIAITSSRLVYKRGLIARRVKEISIDRIEGVNVLQTVMGRIFNYGRLAIRGMGVGEVVLPALEDPIALRKAIDKARSI